MVDDKRANILGRNILPLIGVQLLQQKPDSKSVNLISDDTNSSDEKITNWVRFTYAELSTRIARWKNHMVHTKFLTDFKASQQKGRRIPIYIQEKVERAFRSLIDQGHITNLEKCSDQQFISPIVITVENNQSIKLAMDSKQTIKMIHKKNIKCPTSMFYSIV